MSFTKDLRALIITGISGGIVTIYIAALGGELYFTLAIMIFYPGVLIMLGLLVRRCFNMQLGFRRTLLNLLALWCLPICLMMGVMAYVDGNRPDPIYRTSLRDILIIMAYMAAWTVPVAIVVSYITGALTLWSQKRREKAVVRTCEKRLKVQQPFA